MSNLYDMPDEWLGDPAEEPDDGLPDSIYEELQESEDCTYYLNAMYELVGGIEESAEFGYLTLDEIAERCARIRSDLIKAVKRSMRTGRKTK